ncbi:MAG: hypothetical protein R6U63_12290 [Longimicrobiales bacterium]
MRERIESLPTYDQRLLEVERTAPGFAGVFFENGRAVVLVAGAGNAMAAESALKSAFPQRFSGRSIEIRAAKYSWRELFHWHLYAFSMLGKGVLTLDIMEDRNLLDVGVASVEDGERIRQELLASGVPEDAVQLRVVSRPVLFADTTLLNKFRPVPGGARISHPVPPDTLRKCSSGINVLWGSSVMLLTAAHCGGGTAYIGSVQGWEFQQPRESVDTSVILTEYFDPAFGSCGYRCRYSDAMLLAYADTSLPEHGLIARTNYSGTFFGSKSIAEPGGRFWVTETIDQPVLGETLHKVGPETGWTSGEVIATCKHQEGVPIYDLLCQATVDARADHGDSGAPVFGHGATDQDVAVSFYGILWGGDPDAAGQTVVDTPFIFSPTQNLDFDFGGFLNVEATTSPPAPPAVTINGPSLIRPGDTCTWCANASGGGPYQYTWYNETTFVGNDRCYTGTKPEGVVGSAFDLTATVDNPGGWDQEVKTVTESAYAPFCFQ